MVKQKQSTPSSADSSQLPTMLLSKFARSMLRLYYQHEHMSFLGIMNYKLNSLWKYSCFFPRAIVKIFKLIYKIPNYV